MSSDQGPGAPSFGDLFEDPDAPDDPAAQQPEPAPIDPVVDLVTGHDLDHESAEGSHLVAGFEHPDAEPDPADLPAAEPAALPGPHDAVLVAPIAAAAAAGAGQPSSAAPASAAPVTVAPTPWDGTVDPSVSSAPAPRVDTGRLYRSSGAEGPATLDAIPAIDPHYRAARGADVVEQPEREEPAARPSSSTSTGRSSGLTYTGVAVVVISVTVIAAFLDELLRQEIGVITGVALAVSSIYAALVVRRADIWAAVVMPPLAFLVATITAGQLNLTRTGKFLVDQGSLLFLKLGPNAPWILGTTLVCLVIVLVRRRRN